MITPQLSSQTHAHQKLFVHHFRCPAFLQGIQVTVIACAHNDVHLWSYRADERDDGLSGNRVRHGDHYRRCG